MNPISNKIKLGAEGSFSCRVLTNEGAVVSATPVSGNVVTYEGAYRLFFRSLSSANVAVVGTATTERVRASTSLGNKTATSTTNPAQAVRSSEVDNADGTGTLAITKVFTFNIGDVVGTISEVGVETSSGILLAGQLIKDEFGDPTTITILADEQLEVTYTLELTYPNGSSGSAASVGTGSVSSPIGSHAYTIYAQPYFSNFTRGATRTDVRVIQGLTSQYGGILLNDSGGDYLYSKSLSNMTSSHDGSGNVTVSVPTATLSPQDYSGTDIKYICLPGRDSSNNSQSGIDPITKINGPNTFAYSVAVIEFTPALEKSAVEALSLGITLNYTV